jgi:hypothetical protein
MPGAKNLTVFIPHNWGFNVQGTSQGDIVGRQLYVQSMKHQFRLNFCGLTADVTNPRLRIIHGWVLSQTPAQGTPIVAATATSSVWGDAEYPTDVVTSHLAQQLQFPLTKPNTKVVRVLSDRFYVPRATAGATAGGGSAGNPRFTRTFIEFTKYWKMGRKLNLKIAPAKDGTKSEFMRPQMQEPIPFTAIYWDNSAVPKLSASNIEVLHRSSLRVIDN